MNKDKLSTIVFFVLLLFLLYEAALLLSPFFGPLLCALATAIFCFPLHKRLRNRFFKKSPALQALISDFAVFLFLVVPAALLVFAAINEIQTALPTLQNRGTGLVQSVKTLAVGRIPGGWLAHLQPYTASLRAKIASTGEQWVGMVAQNATGAAKNVFGFVLDGGIFLVVLFFLFKDGETLYRQWDELLPFSATLRKQLHERVHTTVEGVVRSAVVIGLIQGILFLIGYLIVSFPAAVLFACLTGLASLLPGLGSAIIWIPLAIYYMAIGASWKGVVLLIFGVIAGIIDSLIRPLIVGRKADMPFLWLMFAVLGGLEIFGAKGLILGPLVFSLLPVLLDIYRTDLHEKRSIH